MKLSIAELCYHQMNSTTKSYQCIRLLATSLNRCVLSANCCDANECDQALTVLVADRNRLVGVPTTKKINKYILFDIIGLNRLPGSPFNIQRCMYIYLVCNANAIIAKLFKFHAIRGEPRTQLR